jgi:activator of HSP90 ATPase
MAIDTEDGATMNRTSNLVTRRQAIAGMAWAGVLFGDRLMAQQPAMEQKPATAANQSRTSLHYDLEFAAAPHVLYHALLDEKQFAALTGLPASIDPLPGGALSMFSGMIVGRNVELIDNQRIVQAWRPTHWDPGVYSIVHFEFSTHGSGSALSFDHTGFPAGEYDHLDWGWEHHYWEAMRKISAG